MTQTSSTFVFGGGFDPATSPIVMPPGRLMAGMNYECSAEGYRRCDGFERYDGKPQPSDATFWAIGFENGVSAFPATGQVEGATSGATGRLLAAAQGVAGQWTANNAVGHIVVDNITGTFEDGEPLYCGGVLRALASTGALEGEAPDPAAQIAYYGLAQDMRRAAIIRVPGSGPVRGAAIYNNAVYAWRDNEAASAGGMWRATQYGWTEVTMPFLGRFTAGLVEFNDGDVVNGLTSGATATIHRVVRKTGNWGSTAAGYVVLKNIVGTFVGETLRTGTTNLATLAAPARVALPAGGRYMTITHNFNGAAGRFALYGCNGVGEAFEFCDGILTPIETGTADDRPVRIFEIGQALGLIYRGGLIDLGVVGEPLLFDAVQGAVEIAFGCDVTDVVQSTETAVSIFGDRRIGVLSGRDAESFQVDELTEEAGAFPWTAQRVARTVYLDARGLRDLTATQAFGNFRAGSLLPELAPYFATKRKSGVTPVVSFVNKSKSQYRLVWSDGTGLSVFMGRKVPEPLQFSLGDVRLTCACSGELNGGEAIFAGGEDGYLYRIDSGSSFDGIGVRGFVMPAFNHIGALTREKRLHKTTVEMDSGTETRIGVTVLFDYGDGGQPLSGEHLSVVQGGGGIWNAAIWNQFFWSAPLRGKAEAYTEGQGVNMAPVIACDSRPAEAAHTLQAYTFHWSPKRFVR